MVIDGERTYLTGEWLPDEDGTPAQKMIDAGIPQLLFDHFAGRLEWHTPWHADRELSLLMRGRVDVAEANELVAAAGHRDLRFLDNGAIGRPMEAIEGHTHAYHLVPGGASKAKAVAVHMQARGYARTDCIAIGDSIEDLEAAASVGRFFVVANGPERDEALRDALARFENATVTEGRWATASMKRWSRPWPSGAERTLDSGTMAEDHATIAEEEYLQIMFWLEEAGLPITGANIARAMQLSPPTVHEMIGRLERDGYVSRAADKSLTFTDSGREQAGAIVRRHRLIERFLTDVLGVPWDEVHEEAERLEHAMSPVLEERMRAAIGDATTCPHGHPIVEGAREAGVLLADVEPGASVHVLRFENEAEELLHYLKESGLQPGLDGELESSGDDEVVVASADGRHRVSRSVAETVSVRAEPAPAPRAPLPEALVLSSDRYGR